MIVLRSPKGWTGPKEVDGKKVEGFWRAHQVPITDPRDNPGHLKLLEDWMRSYRPEELFDETGALRDELRLLPPAGARRMGASPHANGGLLKRELRLPDFHDFAVAVPQPGGTLAEATRVTIAEQGGKAMVAELDVTRRDQCFALAETVRRDHGHVDILVNSAGSAFRSPAEDFPEDKFNFILDLNLKGTYFCCQAFGGVMLDQRKGSIINIASIGSFSAYPWASAYLASKGGVLQVTRALALEWRDRGVRVNGIGPTLMESPLTKAAASTSSITADFIKARMLRPRLGLPRELIGTAVFLASDASELVTGHVVMCDDGYLTA